MTTPTILETMDRPTCEVFLASGSIGRLAVVVDGAPHIVPVNYAAEGATVVFRTAPGTVVTEASLQRVAFEVDGIDEPHRAGWSVAVHGYGREITDCVDAESRHLQELLVDCWAPDDRDRWFKIIPESVTGRYLGPVTRDQARR